jgi:hypothetical protein
LGYDLNRLNPRLPAKRTENGFANFHAQNLTMHGQVQWFVVIEKGIDN